MCVCSNISNYEINWHYLKFEKNMRNLLRIETVNRFNPGSTRLGLCRALRGVAVATTA
jgi:hypothetical protein